MTLSISGTLPAQPADPPVIAPAPAPQAEQPQTSSDTVVLSQSAQINQLYLQGQTPEQIAENLGLAQSTVNSDLGLVATVVPSEVAAAVPAAPARTSAT